MQPPSVAYKTPVFPEGAWLAITTDQPDETQFITVEVIEHGNLEEIGQIDPEFNTDKKVLLLKIQRQGISLKGPCLLRINWSDNTNQTYSQEVNFEII